MKRYGIAAVAAAMLWMAPTVVMAQMDPSGHGGTSTASQGAQMSTSNAGRNAVIHGKANNPLGLPIANANVFATTDGSPGSKVATFVTDANGEYKGVVPQGTYVFVLQEQNPKNAAKEIDDSGSIHVAEKQDVTVNFDGTREDFVKKLTPEDKKALEEVKARNAAIMADNMTIKHLNELLEQERAARHAGNLDQATQLATEITQGRPTEAVGWYELGLDQLAAKKYDDVITTLQKAIQLNTAAKKPNPTVEAASDEKLGEAFARTKKIDQAVQYYDMAGKLDPAGANLYFTNEAILFDSINDSDRAAAAADKAIAADPTKAMPYYLKGQALVQKAGQDASGKITVPPGCAEAYEKYLELAPDGPRAQDARDILASIGVKVNNKYKATK